MNPQVKGFFDPATYTVSYVIYETEGSACAIIDSVLDYDPKSGRTRTASADQLVSFIREQKLELTWILETHAHADHLSAAAYLKSVLGGKTAIGSRIANVQKVFKTLFNLEPTFQANGQQFDRLLDDNDIVQVGNLSLQALSVPGHTPACIAFRVGDAVFTGDTIFMPDIGTARCDFPGGDARTLYTSIQKILALPDDTRLFLCHDYPPNGRPVQWISSVQAQKLNNIHVHDGVSEEQFAQMRSARDATLEMPVLILPAIQINIRAGELPPRESNGVAYAKIPLNAL